jgi:signal transduction histidine kinase
VPLAVLGGTDWADVLVGGLLVGLGLADRRRVGPLMALTGLAWFAGGLAGPLVMLHRGPLVHLLVTYPHGRSRTRLERAVVAAAYAGALSYPLVLAGRIPLAVFDWVTIALAVPVIVAVGRTPALSPALVIVSALVFGTAARVAGLETGGATLWAYQGALAAAAIALFLLGHRTSLTGLVLDLGDLEVPGTLRDTLIHALGDPSLRLGYWVPAGTADRAPAPEGGYVDEAGRPVEPTGALTVLEEDGQRVGVLVHEAAILGDPTLVRSVASLARLALSNARLQARIRGRVAELESSRRRIVAAGDAERDRLERQLHDGAELRLDRVASLLADDPHLLRELDSCRAELRAFARGIHPRALTEQGLAGALGDLCHGQDSSKTRLSPTIELCVPPVRLPPAVEACAYFVCSEALANAAKYAGATRVRIQVTTDGDAVRVEIADDGVGGADPARGSGLRGLADRVETLGGDLTVDSPPGRGTHLVAIIPRV